MKVAEKQTSPDEEVLKVPNISQISASMRKLNSEKIPSILSDNGRSILTNKQRGFSEYAKKVQGQINL